MAVVASSSAAVMPPTPAGLEIRGDRAPMPTGRAVLAPSTSTAVGQKPGRGRSLNATRSFAPGAALAVFDAPLLAVTAGADATRTCNYCLDVQRPTKACTGCHAAAYCGSRCQRAHWSLMHKLECQALKRALATADGSGRPGPEPGDGTSARGARAIPMNVRALIQILLRWPAVQPLVDRLASNLPAFRAQTALWNDFTVQVAAALSFLGRSPTDEDIALALDILCKIHTNAFDRADVDIGYSGLFLDVNLAMVNHSCIPNAVVVFSRRKAFLRAMQAIAPGEEITISYTDYTKPKSARLRSLQLYNFVCDCPRCTGDLDIYDVCCVSPQIPLNASSFVPDLDILRHPPVDNSAPPVTAAEVEKIYVACAPERPVAPANRRADLRRKWKLCQPLIRARRWAVEPLAHVLQEAIAYYSEQQNFAHALAVECFVARYSDPFKYVAPFDQPRIKGILMIAKTITNTHPGQPQLPESAANFPVHPYVQQAIQALGDGALYEAILLLVMRYAPLGHSDEWEILADVHAMLKDVQSIPGRELIAAALHHWIQDPTEPSAAKFFRENILGPVEHLASVAVDILKADFEK